MISFAQIVPAVESPEWSVGVPVLIGFVCVGAFVFIRWLLNGPASPDPWDTAVAKELADDQAVPLCHRCLAPQTTQADFCPGCGAPVGQYTNLLPYPYLFSVGHMMRLGTSGEFRRTPLTVMGFLLFSLTEYTVFAPLYWIMLFHRRSSRNRPPPVPTESSSS